MPDRNLDDYQAIQRDIAARSADLAAVLRTLRGKLRDRIGLRTRARVVAERARELTREHPIGFAAVAVGLLALGAAIGLRVAGAPGRAREP